ncbi:NB-ARC domain-containing protein [Emticicia sp. W12TSBA100-4]|uniref:NB-ARC domain-containing protein n=1 Tax=Emticicia sp. W12TSBA100-4 TaxID=3160965 RepID=UPI003305DC6C
MGLISSILTLTWITETSLGFIGNRVDESLASKLNIIKKRVKDYLSDTDIPLNNDLQKAVECSHWLATKVFCEELRKRSVPSDILNRIFEVANQQINLIKSKDYIQNLEISSSDIESIILGDEQNINDLLKRKILDFHIRDLNHLLKERERTHLSFENFEQNIRSGLDNLDWFSLACSFLNDSLTGDNNKAKDAFNNYYLAKISKNAEENQQLLMSITNTMNGFVNIIGKERFEEFKLLVKTELQEISNSLSSLHDEVTKVSESIKNVVDSKSLKNERFLTGLPINLNFELIGRENDLNGIIKRLEYQDRVLIYGMRGLGKTTLSKFVLRKLLLENKIDYVAWLSTGNDLQEAFLKDIGEVHLSKQVSNAVNFGSSSIEIIERIIIPYLTNLEGKFKLIVIDNLTIEQFPFFRRISEKLFNWKILATSFQKLSNQRDDFELNLLSISDAIRLFYSNYNRIINESSVEQLVLMVGFHTLTIEILAKTAESLDLTPQALLERFEEKGLNLSQYNLDIEINHNNDLIEGLLPYYQVIFDISALSILEQDLLVKLSIFPSLPFKKNLIISLINTDSQDNDANILALKNLEKRGWISLRDEAYQMHQVIQLVIQQRNFFN